MSCTALELIDRLTQAGALTMTQASSLISSLSAEQRAGDAAKLAQRLIELKRVTAEQAQAALNTPNTRPIAEEENSDLSMMLGIQPLRGVNGRASSSDSSIRAAAKSASMTKNEDGTTVMFGNSPLRGTTGPGSSSTHLPSMTSPGPTNESKLSRSPAAKMWLWIGAGFLAAAIVAWSVWRSL